jgi:dephospho-CoA kinase
LKELNPSFSSESSQTSGEQQPTYKIYEREVKKEEASFIQDMVIVIDVPLLVYFCFCCYGNGG